LSRIYDIGPFRLDTELGALTRAGAPVTLGVRGVAVLKVLVEHAHALISKDRLIDAAWPGVIVEESNLPVQIHAIRRVLAQAPGGAQWIETLAKRGYRFVGPVSNVTETARDENQVVRSNLPQALTSFVGRERDLVEIKRLLPTKRLITIVGAGGIGKTRLALQIAVEVIGAYRDGAWFVDLGALRDGALVPTAVAQALGVQERPGRPLTAALCAHLRSLQLLLIFDNCEHLLGACVQLVDALLKGAAQTTIVATSREPLRAAGEQIYTLQPLSLPQPEAKFSAIQRSEAVQLLVERVRDQLPDFELGADRASAIAELCIHLDGIPLALELAAARARSVSIEQINARLGNRFRLLASGPRTALPRQQTLRATLDWSYDLLGENERQVLRSLAVFAGSFTIDAACAVASAPIIDDFAVIDLLSQLVSRSLLIADTSAGATRYRLLETTRAYAHEKLVEAGERDAAARRHAEHFCKVFEHAPVDWLRMRDSELRATYVPELDHVRSALHWSLGPEGDTATGIALASSSGVLWPTLGLFSEGVRWLERALALVGPQTPQSQHARLWLVLGRLVDETPLRARPALERAAELYRQLGDAVGVGVSLARLGRVLAFAGKFSEAEAALVEARPLLEGSGLPKLPAFFHFNFAFLKSLTGDLVAARSHYEQSLALDREMGDQFGALSAFGNLANVTWALGDLDAAESAFRQQIARVGELPIKTNRLIGWTSASLAGVLTERQKLDEALATFRTGLPLVAEDGSAWMFGDSLALRAAFAGKLADAARLAGHTDAMFVVKQATRHPIDVRHRERVGALLREALSGTELEALLAEGAKLSEAEACRLALEN